MACTLIVLEVVCEQKCQVGVPTNVIWFNLEGTLITTACTLVVLEVVCEQKCQVGVPTNIIWFNLEGTPGSLLRKADLYT